MIPSLHHIKGDYFKYPAISRSDMLRWMKSPLHFFHKQEEIETEAMKRGTLFHEALLEPMTFKHKYESFTKPLPNSTMAKKENKEAWNAIKEAGKIPIQSDVYQNAIYMKNAVFAHPVLTKVFLGLEGKNEIGISWKHPNGEVLKIKVDKLVKNEQGFLSAWDAKTTQDASENGFIKACASYKLELQAAFYSYVLKKVYGDKFRAFVFVMIEEQAPHGIGVYQIQKSQTDQWEAWIETQIIAISEARKRQTHWSYSDPSEMGGIKQIELPFYISQRYE